MNSYLSAHQNIGAIKYRSEETITGRNVNEANRGRIVRSVKKTKKQPATASGKALKSSAKDIPTPPRDILNFEVSDAIVPSVEYEKLYRARNLNHNDRVKRSVKQTKKSRNLQKKNSTTSATSTTEIYTFITLPVTSKPTLIKPSLTKSPPPDVFKFELSDAKIPDPSQIPQRAKNLLSNVNNNSTSSYKSNIYKRDSSNVSMDQKTNESRKIRIIHPLSNSGKKKRAPKYQAYEELPFNTQKIIDKAIADAKTSNKLNDGEYLQFYYGDKIIITPLYPSKPEPPKPVRAPVMKSPMNGNVYESYWAPMAKQKFKLAHDNFVLNPKLLGTKQAYFVADNILKPKKQMAPQMIINVQPTSNGYKEEQTAINFNNKPEQNSIPNLSHLIGQSPSFQLEGLNKMVTNDKPDSKKAVGPILFHPELSQPKPEHAFSYVNVEAPRNSFLRPVETKYHHISNYKQYQHKYEPNHMNHMTQTLNHIQQIQPQPQLPPPTSYQELINYNTGNHHEEKEDYEFG